jgi:hypothetical protein
VALWSTQPMPEMSIRNLRGGMRVRPAGRRVHRHMRVIVYSSYGCEGSASGYGRLSTYLAVAEPSTLLLRLLIGLLNQP